MARGRRRHDPDSRSGACSSRSSACWASTREQARERFGFLLDALQFGAPPHGGIALGIDRWVMLFGGLDNIRDLHRLPQNAEGDDLMTGAPSEVDAQAVARAVDQGRPPGSLRAKRRRKNGGSGTPCLTFTLHPFNDRQAQECLTYALGSTESTETCPRFS